MEKYRYQKEQYEKKLRDKVGEIILKRTMAGKYDGKKIPDVKDYLKNIKRRKGYKEIASKINKEWFSEERLLYETITGFSSTAKKYVELINENVKPEIAYFRARFQGLRERFSEVDDILKRLEAGEIDEETALDKIAMWRKVERDYYANYKVDENEIIENKEDVEMAWDFIKS